MTDRSEVPVLTDDDPDRLAARVLTREHLIYPRVVGWFATGRLRLDEADRLILDGRVLTRPALLHPDGHCPEAGEAPEQAQA